ncbi:hypothetical protein CTI12_AA476500 [Artemisia annua]|uniref:DUF7054 domain-containing protein n=1 Tax=Artemisia annua TaxID=35608 RepID=A0A2U1LM38_ARTAN|nr:hypothetical protein CTI12_AA476500 [Artemisia annua]
MKKTSPKAQVKSPQNRKVRLSEKSSSFHGRGAEDMVEKKLTRPRTVPEMFPSRNVVMNEKMVSQKLTKLLLNVTVHRSLGPVHVLISPDSSVGDLIAAVLRQYVKEGRRPVFGSFDPNGFDLHYSQFSLESLSRDEKLSELGSRNFFLCPKQVETGVGYGGTSSSSCSKEAEKVTKGGPGWLRFMEFML